MNYLTMSVHTRVIKVEERLLCEVWYSATRCVEEGKGGGEVAAAQLQLTNPLTGPPQLLQCKIHGSPGDTLTGHLGFHLD